MFNGVTLYHVDTAVRWRSTNDSILYKRIFGGAIQAVRDIIRIYVAIIKYRPHLIHLCTSGSLSTPRDILILYLARFFRIRSIVHFHMGRLPAIIAGKTWEWRLICWAMQMADRVLLLDQQSEESVKKTFPRIHIERIPNPIDVNMIKEAVTKEALKLSVGGQQRIMYAGWVVPTKGIGELVEACRMIEDVPFELCLVGNVSEAYRSELDIIAAHRHSGKWIRFYGEVSRAKSINLMRSADVIVLPSYTEGFPNVVLEAMALGKPIVATRVGAIPEMLADATDEPSGILVSPRNVGELRIAIHHLLTHPEDARKYGDRAMRRVVSRYEMGVVIKQYFKLWRTLSLALRD